MLSIHRVCLCVQHTETVRCYCNEPACVSTAYICKSQVGLCFSQSTPDVATAVSHGCADSLSAHLLRACTKTDTESHVIDQQQQQQVVRCCAKDLCNYVTSRSGWFKCKFTNLCRHDSIITASLTMMMMSR